MSQLQTIQAKLNEIETSGGTQVPLTDVKAMLVELQASLGVNSGAQLFEQIGALAKFMNTARKDLVRVDGDADAAKKLPDASAQLEEVIRMAHEATHKIMDQAEVVQHAMADFKKQVTATATGLTLVTAYQELQTKVDAAVGEMFEACSFQDITGQRIQKIVTMLQEMERQLLCIVVGFGLKKKENAGASDDELKELREDAELLNGPQLPGQGLAQDDIDALLNTLL